MQRIAALPADALATVCRPDDLPFASTDEVPDLGVILGQQRALQAIQFGLNAARPGDNLFVFGSSGIGKHSTVMRLLSERARQGLQFARKEKGAIPLRVEQRLLADPIPD